MPARRVPSALLELRGSFQAHPERRREDLPGRGEWDPTPPEHLEEREAAAWRELVAVIPVVVLAGSDRFAVAQAARLLAQVRATPAAEPAFRLLDDSLRKWLGELGCTPISRTKLGARTPADNASNPFLAFKRPA
jgi:phage terminase small subunit